MTDLVLPDLEVTAKPDLPAAPKSTAPDVLKLIVGGKEWSGWQRAMIRRSMDQVPSSFSLQVTEKFPLAGDMVFNAGDPCVVKLGDDPLITGYVDRYNAIVSPQNHTVRIDGRSKSQDLVDCSAFMGSVEAISTKIPAGSNTLAIARALAKPYGVEINSTAGDGITIPLNLMINIGETPWEIIDRVTRYSQVIAYDLPDGSVQFAQVGTEKMASGFAQGKNVESGSVVYGMDQRFQLYIAYKWSSDAFSDNTTVEQGGKAPDPGVPRFRLRLILSEQFFKGQSIAQARAQWEANRRAARGSAITVTCDNWRDSAGALWALNHLAPVDMPALKCRQDSWVIGSIVFIRDELGQHAQVTLMAPGAFMPEPIGDITRPSLDDINQNNPTSPENAPYNPAAGGGPTP